MRSAARTNVRFSSAEVKVGAPGIDCLTTAEGNHYKFVGVVDGYEAGYVGGGLCSGWG